MDKLTTYLKSIIPRQPEWEELERYAKEHHVPIMEPVSMHFLLTLLDIHRPKQILEVGTAIGYSALRMADALSNVQITTIEKNEEIKKIAYQNVHESTSANRINIMHGEALDIMKQLRQTGQSYDFVFIDAAKGQYEHYFSLADELLNSRGLIICDNVLFRGYVAETKLPEQRRFEKIADKLRDFNKKLMQNEQYNTTIIPIGDGLSLSVKR